MGIENRNRITVNESGLLFFATYFCFLLILLFWEGKTGYKSFRTKVFDKFPNWITKNIFSCLYDNFQNIGENKLYR
jgi:hypothetical protein